MIVADTNLLVYLHLHGDQTDAAERVRERDPAWAAPPLWRSELRNVLAGYLRRGQISIPVALDVFANAAESIAGREFAVETAGVLDLVASSTCSAYDCEFVMLAGQLGVPLVTSDALVLREFRGTAVSIAEFAR